jgi:hypothetical protein
MNVLAIDIGGTNVKILATGQQEPVKFPSRARHDCQGDGCGGQPRNA